MACAAGENNYIEIVKLCKEWGATPFDWAMACAARFGNTEIVVLKEWGATVFNSAMCYVALDDHIEIMKLCKKWGTTNFNKTIEITEYIDHAEIVKLCREWLCYKEIHEHYHKKKCYRKIWDELLPIAWHPDRWWDWCVSEDERDLARKAWL